MAELDRGLTSRLQLPVASKQLAPQEKGNREFQRKNYAAAIEHFTTAVDLEPLNAVYLSNRSGAHCAAGQYEHALRDGKVTTD